MKSVLILLFIFLTGWICGQENSIRPPRDSIGFCWTDSEMDTLMEYLAAHNKTDKDVKDLIAAISVHDDYLYAGNVYYPLYKNIHTKEVVIFGVTHATVRKEVGDFSNVLILDNYSGWQAPFGTVQISPLREKIKSELPSGDYIVNDHAQGVEHSIEALIPFLQYYNRDIRITPIMITKMPELRIKQLSEKLAAIITDYIRSNNLMPGRDIFFLISNDADHYGTDFNNSPYGLDAEAHDKATANDRRIINSVLTGILNDKTIETAADELFPDSTNKFIPLWCGRYPIVFGLSTILSIVNNLNLGELNGELFRYSDSFSEKVLPVKNTGMGITAVFSYQHWCGWFTEGFHLKRTDK